MKRGFSFKTLEKLTYLLGVPALIGYSAYTLYGKASSQEEERQKLLQEMELKYLNENKDKVVKLENFKKRIFAIGVHDSLSATKILSKEEQMEIGNNSKLIRDIIKDVKPETVVLEMCQDRYDHWFYDAISHPNYDRTLSDVHKILDTGKVEQLMDYKGLEMGKSSAHLEYLVGLDVCSYRMMPCKTVFGDRSIKITNKRYRSKVKMLEVYKEQLQLAN